MQKIEIIRHLTIYNKDAQMPFVVVNAIRERRDTATDGTKYAIKFKVYPFKLKENAVNKLIEIALSLINWDYTPTEFTPEQFDMLKSEIDEEIINHIVKHERFRDGSLSDGKFGWIHEYTNEDHMFEFDYIYDMHGDEGFYSFEELDLLDLLQTAESEIHATIRGGHAPNLS